VRALKTVRQSRTAQLIFGAFCMFSVLALSPTSPALAQNYPQMIQKQIPKLKNAAAEIVKIYNSVSGQPNMQQLRNIDKQSKLMDGAIVQISRMAQWLDESKEDHLKLKADGMFAIRNATSDVAEAQLKSKQRGVTNNIILYSKPETGQLAQERKNFEAALKAETKRLADLRVKQGRIIAAERKKRLEQEAKWQAMRAKQAIESKKTTVSTRTDAGPTPPGTRWLVTKGKHPRVNAGSMLAGVFNITKRKPPGYRPPSRWVMMGREPQPPEFDKRKAAICRGNYNGEWVPGSALFYHGGACLTYWNRNLKVAKEYDVLAPTAKMIASTDKALYPSPIPETLAWVRSSVKAPS